MSDFVIDLEKLVNKKKKQNELRTESSFSYNFGDSNDMHEEIKQVVKMFSNISTVAIDMIKVRKEYDWIVDAIQFCKNKTPLDISYLNALMLRKRDLGSTLRFYETKFVELRKYLEDEQDALESELYEEDFPETEFGEEIEIDI